MTHDESTLINLRAMAQVGPPELAWEVMDHQGELFDHALDGMRERQERGEDFYQAVRAELRLLRFSRGRSQSKSTRIPGGAVVEKITDIRLSVDREGRIEVAIKVGALWRLAMVESHAPGETVDHFVCVEDPPVQLVAPVDQAWLALDVLDAQGAKMSRAILADAHRPTWERGALATRAQLREHQVEELIDGLGVTPLPTSLEGIWTPFGKLEFLVTDQVPEDQVWLASKDGVVAKIVNLATESG